MKKHITYMMLIIFVLTSVIQGMQTVCCANGKIYSVQEFSSLQLGMSLDYIYTTIGEPNTYNENSATYHVENSMKLKLYFDSQDLLASASLVSLKGMEIHINFGDKILYTRFAKQNIDTSSFEKPHDIEEFDFIEIGTSINDVQKKVGMPDYYTSDELGNGVYVLKNGCRLHVENIGKKYRVQHLRLQFEDNDGFYVSFQDTPPRYLWENAENHVFTLNLFSKLKKDIDMEEVYSLFGQPDKFIVCGVVYDLGMNKELVLFVNKTTNTLRLLAIKDKMGSYCFIEITTYFSRIGASNIPIYLDEQTMEHLKTTSPHSLKKFARLKSGMTREEITALVGEPDFYYGNMPGKYAYILEDGNLLELMVKENCLMEVILSFKDRSNCTLSFNEFGYVDIY